jgi:YggT family protein
MTALITQSLAQFLQIYLVLILIRVVLTWFRAIDWVSQVESFLSPITDPYLNIFRSFIPPLGGLDVSPILAIIVLQIVADLFMSLARSAPGTFGGL